MPNLNSSSQVAPLIAREYAVRYRIPEGSGMDAAIRRAQALDLAQQLDPNWTEVQGLLAESNRALAQAIGRSKPAGR
jgi:hypothetical protein